MLATRDPAVIAADAPARRVMRLYEDAQAEVDALFARAIRRVRPDGTGEATARWLDAQRRAVAHMMSGLHARAQAEAYHVADLAYRAGMNVADAGEGAATGGFHGTHRAAVEQIAKAQDAALGQIAAHVGRQADDVFRQVGLASAGRGLAAGTTREQASRAMMRDLAQHGVTGFVARDGTRWQLGTYANMVIRTTSREAVTRGVTNRMIENGDDLVEISDHGESDPECDQYAGNTYSLSGNTPGYEVLPDEPPFHPNLTPGFQPVRLLGEARGGYRARYAGPLVEATTASGVEFAIGPNHPVLTARGWVPGDQLRNGDEVVRDLGFPRHDAPGAIEDLDVLPTLPQDVFDALVAVGDDARIPSAASHFHGDGRWVEGEVHVVRTDGLLSYMVEAVRVEQLRQRGFVSGGGGLAALAGERAGGFGRGGVALAPAGGVRVAMRRPDAYAPLAQELERRAGGDPPLPRELASRFPGLVATDEIIEVRRVEAWQGWAYDFETTSVAYSSGGLVVSNCVHVMFPASVSLDDMEEALGASEDELPPTDEPPTGEPPPGEPPPMASGNPAVQDAIDAELDAEREWFRGQLLAPGERLSAAQAKPVEEAIERHMAAVRETGVFGRPEAYRNIGRAVANETRLVKSATNETIKELRTRLAQQERLGRPDIVERTRRHLAHYELAAQRAEGAARVLAEVRPGFGTGKVALTGRGGKPIARTMVRQAGRWFPREWVDALNERHGGLRIRGQGRRGWFRDHDGTINMSTGPTDSLAAHEVGHGMERLGTGIVADLERLFWHERAGGDQPRPLRDILPGSGYPRDEVAVEDEWIEPYSGKVYPAGHGAWEILTTGMEKVFHGKYGGWDEDVGHRDWVLGVLAVVRAGGSAVAARI